MTRTYRAPLLALLAAIVVGAAWWYFLQQPSLDQQAAFEAETAQLEAEESQLRAEIAELEEVRDNEMALRAELATLQEYIPNGIAQPAALRDIQETADDAGVEVLALSFGAPVAVEEAPPTGEEGTTLAEISVSMTIEGGYFQLVDLIRRFEVDVERALLIQSVSVSEGGEDGFPSLSTNWNGKVFAVVDIADTVEADDEAADPDTGAPDPDAEPGDDDDPDVEDLDDDENDDDDDLDADEAIS